MFVLQAFYSAGVIYILNILNYVHKSIQISNITSMRTFSATDVDKIATLLIGLRHSLVSISALLNIVYYFILVAILDDLQTL